MKFFGKIHDFFFPENEEIEAKDFVRFPNEADRYREIAAKLNQQLILSNRMCKDLNQRVFDLEKENQCLREMLAEVKK
nr:hypothetical protein [Streptococcus lutetiensis]